VDMMFDTIEGLREANVEGQILQAWKAGPETLALRKQLEAMPDGGVYALTVPEAPYRCPPGPYERASQVAHYFKQAKPKSKVLILDANPDITSKAGLFKKFWNDNYKGIIEYRPNHKVTSVDTENSSIHFDIQDSVKADVMNVLPAMRAGAIAVQTGLATANNRWCGITTKPLNLSLPKIFTFWATLSWPHRPCPSPRIWRTHTPRWQRLPLWRSYPV